MKVVFLCGGSGKRMFPITEDKFFLDFLGISLLERQVRLALDAGIRHFIIIANPGNLAAIKKTVSKIQAADFKFALQKRPLGIADALKTAASLLDDEILIVNPNDVIDESAYAILLREYSRGRASSYMLGYEVQEYFPGGYLAVNSRKELTRIEEKPEPGSEPSNVVNILLHIHREPAVLLKHIDKVKTNRDDVYERALHEMIRSRHVIRVVRYKGHWAPIKYPWHILNVIRYYLDNARPRVASSASVSDRATITGNVIIGHNARVLENAVIRGPAYIGPGTIIGNNALVRDYSHIGANCVVGFSTEVKTSYVGNSCWFHSSYIGDSVIGNNCSFGAGTVTANFRFDEGEIPVRYGADPIATGRDKFGAVIGDNCKTGINSGILPGRRIGPNSIIGSHVLLTTDLEPDSIILNQPDYHVRKNKIKSGAKKLRKLERKLDN